MKVTMYTDGSTIVRNPSEYGGTYAFLLVNENGTMVHNDWGVYSPEDMGTSKVTNNQMELLAVLMGLKYAEGSRYRITKIVSDSKVTLGRVFQNWSLNNIPEWMVDLKDSLSVRGIRGEFQKGHAGHKWNELADQIAETAAIRFLTGAGLEHLIYQHKNPWYLKYKKQRA